MPTVLEFLKRMEMAVEHFKKRNRQSITCKIRGRCTQRRMQLDGIVWDDFENQTEEVREGKGLKAEKERWWRNTGVVSLWVPREELWSCTRKWQRSMWGWDGRSDRWFQSGCGITWGISSESRFVCSGDGRDKRGQAGVSVTSCDVCRWHCDL